MIETDRIISGNKQKEDQQIDRAIRPKLLQDYHGQPVVKEQMEIFIEAAKKRKEALDHVVLR